MLRGVVRVGFKSLLTQFDGALVECSRFFELAAPIGDAGVVVKAAGGGTDDIGIRRLLEQRVVDCDCVAEPFDGWLDVLAVDPLPNVRC